jgi:hypothetical protein
LKIPAPIANNNSPKLRSEKLRKQKENSGRIPRKKRQNLINFSERIRILLLLNQIPKENAM